MFLLGKLVRRGAEGADGVENNFMIDKEKASLDPRKQWAKFIVVLAIYLLILLWLKSWLGLVVVPFIFDVYITKKIKWQWWRDSEGVTRFVMSWVDALVFALVAVYFINLFFFQNYVIPSSSLEKSLLTGDYLFVSKVSYGPRKPQTPLTLPLTQHTLPVFECRSYIEWPQWPYERAKGLGQVQLNDIVCSTIPPATRSARHHSIRRKISTAWLTALARATGLSAITDRTPTSPT